MKKQQNGFTLIELVMVIVILGILAAFALPRFADLSTDAKKASLNGLAGALKSASAIARSSQLAKGSALGTTVTLDGQAVTMVNGYPTANAVGISAAASISLGDYSTSQGAGGTDGGDEIIYSLAGDSANSSCTVSYQAATAGTDNTAPITSAPVVIVTNSGC